MNAFYADKAQPRLRRRWLLRLRRGACQRRRTQRRRGESEKKEDLRLSSLSDERSKSASRKAHEFFYIFESRDIVHITLGFSSPLATFYALCISFQACLTHTVFVPRPRITEARRVVLRINCVGRALIWKFTAEIW